jgi:hypothetical protein
MATQNIYPGALTWLGVARELSAGVPLVPVITHPMDQGSFEPEDTPKFLQDKAIRGAMTDLFYETLGVVNGTFSFGGPNFLDSHGYFMDNLMGDLSSSGNTPTNPLTTSAVLGVGATVMTVSGAPPAGYSAGAAIQLGTATSAISEVLIVSGTDATHVTFGTTPLRFTHPTSQTVNTVVAPFTHKFAALNSPLGYGGFYGAQPPTHTFTDVTNIVNVFQGATVGGVTFPSSPANPFGARMYPSGVVKQMDFSGNAEQILGVKMSGDSWLSIPAGTAVTNVTTNSRPVPNWNSTVTILGSPASQIGEFSFSFKRTTQVYWTVNGTQTPLVIARGPLNMDGSLMWDPTTTEQPLDMMLTNAQGPMTIVCSNTGIPNSGTPFTLTFTASQVANIKSKINRSKALVGYTNTFEGVANSTDIGGSGGLGPGTMTLVNATPTY